MTDPTRIGNLLTRIQEAFLNQPSLKLTRRQAALRFGVDEVLCGAVLRVLVDASVLAKTRAGTYVRFVPQQLDRVA